MEFGRSVRPSNWSRVLPVECSFRHVNRIHQIVSRHIEFDGYFTLLVGEIFGFSFLLFVENPDQDVPDSGTSPNQLEFAIFVFQLIGVEGSDELQRHAAEMIFEC